MNFSTTWIESMWNKVRRRRYKIVSLSSFYKGIKIITDNDNSKKITNNDKWPEKSLTELTWPIFEWIKKGPWDSSWVTDVTVCGYCVRTYYAWNFIVVCIIWYISKHE